MKRRRLSGWSMLGAAIGLCVGVVTVITLMFNLAEGEELSSEAFTGLYDLALIGATVGLIVGLIVDLRRRIRRWHPAAPRRLGSDRH